MELSESEKNIMFSVFENMEKEKKKALASGISNNGKKQVLIVDSYNTFFRAFNAIPTMNEDGIHTGGMTGYLKSVGSAIKLFKPDRCVAVFDGVGGSLKRRKIYPEYKNHRKTKVRLNRIYADAEDSTIDKDNASLKKQLERLVMYLTCLPLNMVSLDNVEADDTIAYCATEYFKDWDVIIMSADKDFLQLVNNHVKVWSPTKKRLYGPTDVLNEYGISSNNFVIYRTLDGDVSDNIDGIKGCGLKTIIKAFPFLSKDTKVNLTHIKEYAENRLGDLKVYDNIVNNWSVVERNYELMQLENTQLQTFAQLHVNELFDKPITKLNRFELSKMIAADKLWNNIPNYNAWITECFTKLNSYII